MTKEITINTETPITAYLKESQKPSNVGLVIAHDVFGVDDDIRSRMEYWSAMGYTLVTPDLFSHKEGLSPLGAGDVDALDKHQALFADFDVERGLKDVLAAIEHLKGQGCDGVGVLGFGLGGLLAWLAAAKGGSEASVSYCGLGIENHLDAADKIKSPVSLYLAENDELVDSQAQQAINEALDYKNLNNKDIRVFTHPYVSRGFARWDSHHRDRCALTLAEHRAGEFFYMNLRLKHWHTPAAAANG